MKYQTAKQFEEIIQAIADDHISVAGTLIHVYGFDVFDLRKAYEKSGRNDIDLVWKLALAVEDNIACFHDRD